MRKGRDGEKKTGEKNGEKKRGKKKENTDEKKWPLRHCQQSTARMPTAGTPHARANIFLVHSAAQKWPSLQKMIVLMH